MALPSALRLILLAGVASVGMPSTPSAGERNRELDWLHVGQQMSATEAGLLEARLKTNPEELEPQVKLLAYGVWHRGPSAIEAQERKIGSVLRLIRTHPDLPGEFWQGAVPMLGIGPADGPAAIRSYIESWYRAFESRPHDARIPANAGHFFAMAEPATSASCFERAARLEPGNPEWARTLGMTHLMATWMAPPDRQHHEALLALQAFERAISLTPIEDERLPLYEHAADTAWFVGREKQAKQLSERLLQCPAAYARYYSGCVHHGNRILGHLALDRDDRKESGRRLLASAKITSYPRLGSTGPSFTLAAALLAAGERSVVVEYLESCRKFWTGQQEKIDELIATINRSETPLLLRFFPRKPPGRPNP